MRKSGSVIENRAAAVVRKVRTGVRLVRRDNGKLPGTRDFEVVYPDGREEPLEVTRATLPDLNQAQAEHAKQVGFAVVVVGLRRQWTVYPTTASSFRNWTPRSLYACLQPLEANGINELLPPLAKSLPVVAQAARFLGITAAFAHEGMPGHVVVSSPSDDRIWVEAPSNPGRYAIEALEGLAVLDDNRRKLHAPEAVERHLVVWIDEANYLPWRDLVTGRLPNRAPQLPQEITTG